MHTAYIELADFKTIAERLKSKYDQRGDTYPYLCNLERFIEWVEDDNAVELVIETRNGKRCARKIKCKPKNGLGREKK